MEESTSVVVQSTALAALFWWLRIAPPVFVCTNCTPPSRGLDTEEEGGRQGLLFTHDGMEKVALGIFCVKHVTCVVCAQHASQLTCSQSWHRESPFAPPPPFEVEMQLMTIRLRHGNALDRRGCFGLEWQALARRLQCGEQGEGKGRR
jgi:hypothetical protein